MGWQKDGEGEWGNSAHYDYGFRIYDPSIARFLSVDPLTASYPWYTPYQFAGNKPIVAIDLDGLEEAAPSKNSSKAKQQNQTKQETAKTSTFDRILEKTREVAAWVGKKDPETIGTLLLMDGTLSNSSVPDPSQYEDFQGENYGDIFNGHRHKKIGTHVDKAYIKELMTRQDNDEMLDFDDAQLVSDYLNGKLTNIH